MGCGLTIVLKRSSFVIAVHKCYPPAASFLILPSGLFCCMHAVCLVHVDNLCDMVLSAWGKQKLDKLCESFCSYSQVLEPFLDDNDLTEDVRAFPCIALEDLA